MRRTLRSTLAAAFLVTVLVTPVAAAAPDIQTLELFPFRLDDAVAAYVEEGEAWADCGDFAILATFSGSVTVIHFGDRMIRQVSYSGQLYNSEDLSKVAGRYGRTATVRTFDAVGAWTSVTIHGIADMAALPGGRHVPVSVGVARIDFTADPPLLAFTAGPNANVGPVCDALR
jgi:hypothetical protein